MRILLLAVIVFLAACGNEPQQSSGSSGLASAPDGKAIFQQNCATCHNPLKDATGPALTGVLARWNNDTARVKAFIRNSSKLISEGDTTAVKLYKKYHSTAMTAFPDLSDAELNALIATF